MKTTDIQEKGTRKEQALKTRRRIFDKALEMFSHTDMDEIRIKDLCAQADVSVGTFYNYYESKEDLLLEAYRFFDEELVSRARMKRYPSNLDAIYAVVGIQCGNHEGLFDEDSDPQSLAIMRRYAEGELLLWKQVLRVLLKNGGRSYIESDRPMNAYVLELTIRAIMVGELCTDKSPEEIASSILRISRGTIFDWAARNAPYCMYARAIDDVRNYLSPMQSDTTFAAIYM